MIYLANINKKSVVSFAKSSKYLDKNRVWLYNISGV